MPTTRSSALSAAISARILASTARRPMQVQGRVVRRTLSSLCYLTFFQITVWYREIGCCTETGGGSAEPSHGFGNSLSMLSGWLPRLHAGIAALRLNKWRWRCAATMQRRERFSARRSTSTRSRSHLTAATMSLCGTRLSAQTSWAAAESKDNDFWTRTTSQLSLHHIFTDIFTCLCTSFHCGQACPTERKDHECAQNSCRN